MWIALLDATLANGTLQVIPGSFLETFAHERDPGSDHHVRMIVDEARAVPIEIPAGGAIFFNYGTAHATKANDTDHERAGLAFHFLRADYLNNAIATRPAHVTGPAASGGLNEYGFVVAGAWEAEVARALA